MPNPVPKELPLELRISKRRLTQILERCREEIRVGRKDGFNVISAVVETEHLRKMRERARWIL